jgi:two-component system response regulator FlrC
LTNTRETTILIAEDNAALRSLLAELLESKGFRVLEAEDGVRTVRTLAKEHVDAVIIDVRLDLEDGVALARELRIDWPDLPIALMSGDSSGPEALKRAGGLTDIFLAKPFTIEKLSATIDDLLGRP